MSRFASVCGSKLKSQIATSNLPVRWGDDHTNNARRELGHAHAARVTGGEVDLDGLGAHDIVQWGGRAPTARQNTGCSFRTDVGFIAPSLGT